MSYRYEVVFTFTTDNFDPAKVEELTKWAVRVAAPINEHGPDMLAWFIGTGPFDDSCTHGGDCTVAGHPDSIHGDLPIG